MIVDTHLLISQIIYKSISKEINFKLNRLDFAYGNIKPDFNNNEIKCGHTLDESLYCVNKYSEELKEENISNREFSRALGVINHFVCDYFCLYHRDGNEKKGVFEHLIYELILHIKLIALLLTGKIHLSSYETFGNSVEAIVWNLQTKYNSEAESLSRDITYALFVASQISKLIICSSSLRFQQGETNISAEYRLGKVNGGNL
ncbi:MAG: zinc dependent phospholipase C family protein [Clostridiaceae bacterium]|nr:zinc dependent phospholipase C family protein [Clostridiaceae bacterium]